MDRSAAASDAPDVPARLLLVSDAAGHVRRSASSCWPAPGPRTFGSRGSADRGAGGPATGRPGPVQPPAPVRPVRAGALRVGSSTRPPPTRSHRPWAAAPSRRRTLRDQAPGRARPVPLPGRRPPTTLSVADLSSAHRRHSPPHLEHPVYKICVVGLGGSGGKTLRFLMEQLKAELASLGWTDDQLPRCWEFVHIDVPAAPDGLGPGLPPVPSRPWAARTSRSARPTDDYVVLDAALQRSLVNQPAGNQLRQLARWRPQPSSVDAITHGAGQLRAVGRLLTLARAGMIYERARARSPSGSTRTPPTATWAGLPERSPGPARRRPSRTPRRRAPSCSSSPRWPGAPGRP